MSADLIQPAATASAAWVMTWSNDTGAVLFVGPFPNEKAASDWGGRWDRENGNDPSWQVLLGVFPRIKMLPPEVA